VATELLVSWCSEDITWVSQELTHFDSVIISSKCDTHLSPSLSASLSTIFSSPKVKVVSLPNVGVCDNTYLHHIVHNWPRIANWTVFYKGTFAQECPPHTLLPPMKYRYGVLSQRLW
jgi:hypothetical protein